MPNISSNLRTMVLHGSPPDFGLETPSNAHHVWGVVMDMMFANGMATLISLADGSASIYFGSGGGVIGGGGHEGVVHAAKHCVSVADHQFEQFQQVNDTHAPAAGSIRFYALTSSGRSASSDIDEKMLTSKRHPLSTLFYAAQAVITQLRLLTET